MARIPMFLPLAAWLLLLPTTATLGDPSEPRIDREVQGSWSSVQVAEGKQDIRQVTTSVDIGLGHRVTLAINLPAESCDRFAISMAARGALIPMAQDLESDILRVEFEVDKQSVWQTTLRLDPDSRDGLYADSGQLNISGQSMLDSLAKGGTLRIKIALDTQVRKLRVPLQGFGEAMTESRGLCVAALEDSDNPVRQSRISQATE